MAPPLPGVHLRRTVENGFEIAEVARSARLLGLAGVLDALDRQAEEVRVPGLAVDYGFTWDEDDRNSPRWWPQGITTSADADGGTDRVRAASGREHRVLLTSAYSKTVDGRNHGSRITVVDLDTLRYRHVLLVVPSVAGGRLRLAPLEVHAGGIVWCGPYLYVAGTRRGLFTCRLDDLIEVEPGPETFGYAHVLPVRFGYDALSADGVEAMRYSFLSLDRGAGGDDPHLVAGEYGRDGMTQRLVRFPLDPETSHLRAEDDGTSRPIHLDERGVGHMQGATVVDGTHYVTSSRGRWKLGSVFVGNPGSFTERRQAIPNGPEDIAYWPAQDAFWSLSEYPGRRYVFRVPRANLR
ncbi:hypothetical protein [Marmoricola sp. RAF53]|uniref:hypothetical protein n=1 Tax=Marmoricola sp. RAF53 TaxID=3233059 RepID=UPI003F9A5BC0